MFQPLSAQLRACEVCVLVPYRTIDGQEVSPDYDTPDYRQEVAGWFANLGLSWSWQPLAAGTLSIDLERLKSRSCRRPCLFLNLCDGNEAGDEFPGLTVVRALEDAGLPFTGAGPAFYERSTSKTAMKEAFRSHGVPTADWCLVRDPPRDVPEAFRQIGFPLIVKPDMSGGSYGISERSVVYDEAAALAQVLRVLAGMHGLAFRPGGVFLERFIVGREFTALVLPATKGRGSVEGHDGPCDILLAERVFNSALPPGQRLLSYERYWGIYKEETPLSAGEVLYRYAPVPPNLEPDLRDVCVEAFRAVGGDSYARVDLRMNAEEQFFVLEVNANCGISSSEDSSVGLMCRQLGRPFAGLLAGILEHSLTRQLAASLC